MVDLSESRNKANLEKETTPPHSTHHLAHLTSESSINEEAITNFVVIEGKWEDKEPGGLRNYEIMITTNPLYSLFDFDYPARLLGRQNNVNSARIR